MTPREVIAETARLAAERGWEQGAPQEAYLLSLLHHVKALWNDLDRLQRVLMMPSPLLNTLGELQQRPAAVEAAVGEFAAADKALREYLSTFPAELAQVVSQGERLLHENRMPHDGPDAPEHEHCGDCPASGTLWGATGVMPPGHHWHWRDAEHTSGYLAHGDGDKEAGQ